MLAVVACVLALSAAAATFEPDSDGQYKVELEMQANNQYLMFVLKGNYDQTNYIEAYANAEDDDILYFEQKTSDADGKVTFGPFVPSGYYDATIILGGTNLDEPYLAGYLSAAGVSNSASITVSGLEQTYTVKGIDSDDYVAELDIEVLDSFGYPSLVKEEVTIGLENTDDGVSLKDNVITISNVAKEQTFAVNISAGETEKTVYVNVVRETPVHTYIDVYTDGTFTETTEEFTVIGTADNYPALTVFAKSFDQYAEEIEDTFSYTYANQSVDSTFTPVEGQQTLIISSDSSDVEKSVTVNTTTRPDYQGSALELYNLIVACAEKLDEEKNISTDGKDVFPEETWTTQNAITAFSSAIATAETALGLYGSNGYSDNDYSDEVTALTKALNTYNNSFKAGTRVDITSISFEVNEIELVLGDSEKKKIDVSPVTEPGIARTTDVITWTSSDETVAKITALSSDANKRTATVSAVGSGKATITATTRAGMSASFSVTVIKPATQILISPSSLTVTYGGEKAVLTAKVSPKDSTDIINWTYDSSVMNLELNEYVEGAYRVVEATVIPKANGKAKVKAEAVYGGVSGPECTVTTVMPEWETVKSPVASQASGPIYMGTAVSLASDTENATIYYTLDGTIPSRTNGRLYKNPIAINQSLTLKAIAVCDGYYDSEVATYEYNAVNTKVSVSSAVSRAGGVAKVFVDVTGFENVTWSGIALNFDPEVLEYYGHSVDENYDIQIGIDETYVSVWYKNDKGTIPDGRILEVSFRVKAQAAEGNYDFVTTANITTTDDEGMIEAAISEGKITVNNYILGDSNNDGTIGLADVLLIKQYAAGKESAIKNILLEASDVDGDGDVDNDDAILVSKYCVGWDVTFSDIGALWGYRIVSSYDVGQDVQGLWRLYYDLYDPYTGEKVKDVTSAATGETASELVSQHLIEKGTIVELSGSPVDENDVVNTIDLDNLVWIKSVGENELVVVPVDDTVMCNTCANEYIENHDGTTYTDILGNEHTSNVVKITSSTKFSVMKRSQLDDNFFVDATMTGTTLSDLLEAGNNLLCYNEKSFDRNMNYVTTYADYAKAFVCTNGKGEATFVIVVVNGNEMAALSSEFSQDCPRCWQ